MAINSANSSYEVSPDSDLANILHYFEPDFIMDIVNTNLQNNYRPYNFSVSNIVNSYEADFNNKISQFPHLTDQLTEAKNNTYKIIINIICNHFNLSHGNIDDLSPENLFKLTSIVYETFVSKFTQNLVTFFSEFIIREAESLYISLNLVEYKKNKDNSNVYFKKVFDNQNLGIVVANFDIIAQNITNIDIPIQNIFSTLYGDLTEASTMLQNFIYDNNNFYKNYLCPYLSNPETFATVSTMIKLEIQRKKRTE